MKKQYIQILSDKPIDTAAHDKEDLKYELNCEFIVNDN